MRLLRLCAHSTRASGEKTRMGDHPVIWTNPHYKARNVYFQFGHKAGLLRSATLTRLLLDAIRWSGAQ